MTVDTRLLAATTLEAEGRRKMLEELGLQVPKDTSLISMGRNLKLAAYTSCEGQIDPRTLTIIQKNLLDEKAKWSFRHPK